MLVSLISWIFHKMGWRIEGELPPIDKYILIAAPHTSNWDFIIAVMAKFIVREDIHFLGKHQLFIPPWGWLFRALGGSPVNRNKNNNLVETAVHEFDVRNAYKLALAPEGTRSAVTRWKTGFYHIAQKANVPIVCIGLDFKNKAIIIQSPFEASGQMNDDMNLILDFFRSVNGKYPKVIPDFFDTENR
ncbi:lysophospholipid acyltransferase family protein [Shewanella sp. 202IG2-18]|uniref:lysophospholipid acyltransferase family protein n=1 Tax=Parashewanella hymeniacidonis TaxID=2807618 RepID=UPI00195F67FF|nr:lysophospholipid acyltransferase family protein [Parashewanella hymeniacidonis]MBM7071096.1 lysophospholipid acyltransferase family protein [Parashewanella hymeniacidonis]